MSESDETVGASTGDETVAAGDAGAWPDGDPTVGAAPPGAPPGPPTADDDRDGRQPWLLVLGGMLVVGVAVGVAAALLSGGGGDQTSKSTTTAEATTSTSTPTSTSTSTPTTGSTTATTAVAPTTAPTTTTTTAPPVAKPAFTSASASPGAVPCVPGGGSPEPVTLSWSTTNATSVSVAGVTGEFPPNGSVRSNLDPCTNSSNGLVAHGPGGDTSTTITWTHLSPPP